MGFKPEEVLFSPTTNCNLNCPHCTAKKTKEMLPNKIAARFLSESKRCGISRVGFTGGEPFLAIGFVSAIVKRAVREGMLFDRIMTNGVWWESGRELEERLSMLFGSGYDGYITVSIDALHNQDLAKLRRFIMTAVSVSGRPDSVSIACVSGAKDGMTRDKLEKLSVLLDARLEGFGTKMACIKGEYLFVRIFKIDLSPIGRAAGLKDPWDGRWFREDHCKGPGNVFLVMPNGDVKPCCGYASDLRALTIGNIKRDAAEEIMKEGFSRNRFVSAVFNSGLSGIRRRLERSGFKFPGRTTNHCYFCSYLLTRVPPGLLKAGLKALILTAVLVNSIFLSPAEAQFLTRSKDFRRISARIVEKIPIPRGYHEGLFCDDGSIWVANGKKGRIWVVDKTRRAVVSEIEPPATFTEAITKGPDGRFFVSDWDTKKIYDARLENGRLIADSSVSTAPAHPAGLIWTGRSLYAITWTRGFGTRFHLVEMDGKMNVIRKIRIRGIQEPAHLAYDGTNLWLTSWYNSLVYKVDTDKIAIVSAFRLSVPLTTGIVRDGNYFWVTGTYSDLYRVEVEGGAS